VSGYLQRLVNSAAGRADSVHPRTGSIFSPPRDDVFAPVPRGEDNETVAAALRLDQPAPPADVSQAEPTRRVMRESAYVPLLPAAEAPAGDAAPSRPPASPAVLSGAVEPIAARVLQPGEPRQRDAATETQIAPQLHPRAGDAVPALTNGSRTGDVAARSVEPRRISRNRQADRGERQADDIQIHIGRIEVVAVQPPVPRPLKAPDRALSLDEYLNRRDRRPR
jgi:hypothetical protein